MYSPTAELNAYILDYKAKKSLENTPFSSPISYRHAKYSPSPSKSWLQDVITMPDQSLSVTPQKSFSIRKKHDIYGPTKTDDGSITAWLDKLDEKIAMRFPKINSRADDSDSVIRSVSNSTMELLSADPETGLTADSTVGKGVCHCASYDSHPNMTSLQNTEHSDGNICECEQLEAAELVEGDSKDSVCDSCLGPHNSVSTTKPYYMPKVLDASVQLPQGYSLINKPSPKRTKKKKASEKSCNQIHDAECFRKNLAELYNNMLCSCPDSSDTNSVEKTLTPEGPESPVECREESKKLRVRSEGSLVPRIPQTPDSASIMNLLELAITQLQEVKVAVEDNTVSAITSDISATSQLLSDFTPDVSGD